MSESPSTQSPIAPKRRSFLSRVVRKLIFGIVIACLLLFGMSMTASKPTNLGLTDGRLATCPDSPNCVSTMASDEAHRMEAVDMTGINSPLNKVKTVVAENFSRAKLVEEADNYCRFEFSSLIFRFVDDVEFYVDDDQALHFRSASRVGHSDMGANRSRMDKLIVELKKGLDDE
jgi:uncharacterized protein (DUF1499 family)